MDTLAYLELERLRYWQGQLLRSRDFNDQAALAAQMRGWHNQVLHRAYGVCSGLEIKRPESSAIHSIGVACGLAYDRYGRALILRQETIIELPAASEDSDWLLLIRSKEQTRFKRDCCPELNRRSPNEAELIWKPIRHCISSDGVALARIKFRDGTASFDDHFLFPQARPLARPRIASGKTLPGNTPWEMLLDPSGRLLVGMQTRVDTSAAGFSETPCYFAWLEATPKDEESDLLMFAILNLGTDIAATSSTEFTFRIILPIPGLLNVPEAAVIEVPRGETIASEFLRSARKIGLHICWLGCEHLPETSVCLPCDCHCEQAQQPDEPADAEKENHHVH